jgi:zeaxanthin glucosyltransferase
MATIVFCVSHMIGEVVGTFCLAKDLRSRGHRVVYVALAEVQYVVTNNGFEFHAVFADEFPHGSVRSLEQALLTGNHFGQIGLRLKTMWKVKRLVRRMLAAREKSLISLFREIAPDLVLVGTDTPYAVSIPLAARWDRAPTLYLTQMLSALPPDNGKFARARRGGETRPTRSRRERFWADMSDALGLSVHWERVAARLAIQGSFQSSDIDMGQHCCVPFEHLCLWPTAFDYPTPVRSHCHYTQPCVDLDRRDGSFDWSIVDPSKRLIFCALGSEIHRVLPLVTRRLLLTILRAAELRRDWQFVVATAGSLLPHGRHVITMDEVPQLEVLQRTAVMITHGGSKSVKEAISHGVPLVVFPAKWDQFANANRVKHHGLGRIGDFYSPSVPHLIQMIDGVLKDSKVRRSCTAMSDLFNAAEREGRAVRLIEQFLPQ